MRPDISSEQRSIDTNRGGHTGGGGGGGGGPPPQKFRPDGKKFAQRTVKNRPLGRFFTVRLSEQTHIIIRIR